MKIAILGTRGIPNRYGGFEAFAENLSRHLAERGHEVTVYCRRAFTRPGDETLIDPRIRRVVLPGVPAKHLDTPIHTLLAALHVAFSSAEVVLICNVGNSPFAWLPRLFGKPVVLNVDGLDRQRRKWGWLARTVLHFCEALSVVAPTRVVTDSLSVQRYYRERYGKASAMIGYGAELPPPAASAAESPLAQFHLESRRYILYVSRLEPENHPELVIAAYQQAKTEWPLVMVGSNAYRRDYEARLRAAAGPRVIFTGAIYGAGYWELQRNAGIFVFACEVGGIHPALIEALAAGNPCLYLDTESNRETAGDCGLLFPAEASDLARKMQQLVLDPDLRARLSACGRERARALYDWQRVTEQYEQLFRSLVL